MKDFYDENRSARILNLIEHKHSISLGALVRKLDVSSKTVKNDIKKLNDSLGNSAF